MERFLYSVVSFVWYLVFSSLCSFKKTHTQIAEYRKWLKMSGHFTGRWKLYIPHGLQIEIRSNVKPLIKAA